MTEEHYRSNAEPEAENPPADEVSAELQDLRLKVKRLERDNRMLAIMNENAEKMRVYHEAEKNCTTCITTCCSAIVQT